MESISTLKKSFVLVVVLFTAGCSTAPEPINYGQDGCHYCKMTIVDKIYGAEMVTDKGKVFKFDAIECMINYSKELNFTDDFQFLANHFEEPEKLKSVEGLSFLISKNLPSPMGANLTAFANPETAKKIQQEKEGQLYNWKELRTQFE